LYYDSANTDNSLPPKPRPGLIAATPPANSAPTSTSQQALEITALAVLPTGSRRLLQYLVAPTVISPALSTAGAGTGTTFPAALTMDGSNLTFQDPTAASYQINGQDACKPAPAAVEAIAYTSAADYAALYAKVLPQKSNYPGAPVTLTGPAPGTYVATTPSVASPPTVLSPSWQNPATLDAVMQDIANSADVVINNSSATGTDISNQAPTMSSSNPLTIVVNGDLNLNGWHNTGYGLLLVTGTLHYDPDASWNGLVLVVGQGVFSSSKNGSGGIQGAVFVAKTRDSSGNLLTSPTLGSPFFGTLSSYGSHPGFGISYNSCLAQSAQGPLTYKVLSFREIPLTN
jgi:hypothetical protein